MNLMNMILEQAIKSLGNGQQGPLVHAFIDYVQQHGGEQGIATMIENFEKNGLGRIVQSWISTGQNMPITPEQVEQGLGEAHVQQISSAANMTPQETTTQLAQILPKLVDKLSPSGELDTQMISTVLGIFNAQKAA
ncbi:MAG: YidB family protein [Alphaproteobacteria bacterium]|nr:YidB family protein [Alphaproteobacteria bacterium]